MSSVASNVCKVLAVAGVAAVVLGGCSSKRKMGQYTIEVSLDPALAGSANVPTIPVDIVGVQPTGEATWNNQSLNEYFAASNPFRMSADRAAMVFGPGDTGTETLRFDDALWTKWKGAQRLYIVADLPGASADLPGDADPRRLILPLDTRHWDGTRKTIRIEVQRADLVLRTEMKPLPTN